MLNAHRWRINVQLFIVQINLFSSPSPNPSYSKACLFRATFHMKSLITAGTAECKSPKGSYFMLTTCNRTLTLGLYLRIGSSFLSAWLGSKKQLNVCRIVLVLIASPSNLSAAELTTSLSAQHFRWQKAIRAPQSHQQGQGGARLLCPLQTPLHATAECSWFMGYQR